MEARSRIIGVGAHVPERVVTNDDLSRMMDTSDTWIAERTGIRTRHWADPDTATSDLALEAANRALAGAGVSARDLDAILLGTLSPDHQFPGTACFLQAKMGVEGIPAIDVRQQCSGFVYAVSIADQFIRTGMFGTVLVVGAEIHSKGLDVTTRGRDVSVLFGDGAGAVVLQRTGVGDPAHDRHVLSTHLHADGSFARELWMAAPGMAYPGGWMDPEALARGEQFPVMNGRKVFVHAVDKMSAALEEALDANDLGLEDVDLFLFHQANLRISTAVGHRLGLDPGRVYDTIQRFGNTTAASIPIGMAEAVAAGRLRPGMLVACAAFGSGFTWGSMLVRW